SPREETYEGKKYYKGADNGCIHFSTSRLFVVADEASMKKALSTSANRKAGPLDDGVAYLSSGRQFVMARKWNKLFIKLEINGKEMPEYEYEASGVSVSGDTGTVEEVYTFSDSTKAASAKAFWDGVGNMGKEIAEKIAGRPVNVPPTLTASQ